MPFDLPARAGLTPLGTNSKERGLRGIVRLEEIRILAAGLRFAQDQIEEAEAALSSVTPRTTDLAGQLARLKEIRIRIDDEWRTVPAQLQASEAAS